MAVLGRGKKVEEEKGKVLSPGSNLNIKDWFPFSVKDLPPSIREKWNRGVEDVSSSPETKEGSLTQKDLAFTAKTFSGGLIGFGLTPKKETLKMTKLLIVNSLENEKN